MPCERLINIISAPLTSSQTNKLEVISEHRKREREREKKEKKEFKNYPGLGDIFQLPQLNIWTDTSNFTYFNARLVLEYSQNPGC